jgi:hypothetical protein
MGVANCQRMQLVVLVVLRNLGSRYHACVRYQWVGSGVGLCDFYSSLVHCLSSVDHHHVLVLCFDSEWWDCVPAYGWNRDDAGIQIVLVWRDLGYSEVVEAYTRPVRKLQEWKLEQPG